MTQLFQVLDEAQVILRKRGVFRQAKVYKRGGAVYAGVNGGFIRLMAGGLSTQPDTVWESFFDPRGEIRLIEHKPPVVALREAA